MRVRPVIRVGSMLKKCILKPAIGNRNSQLGQTGIRHLVKLVTGNRQPESGNEKFAMFNMQLAIDNRRTFAPQ
jgi:hypothetical protein